MAATRLPLRLSLLVRLLTVSSCWLGISAIAADTKESTPPAFEWNVYLVDWQVVGPFPKLTRDQRSSEIDRVLVDDEAKLRPGEPVTVAGKEYEWRRWPGRMVDFIRALRVDLPEGLYALAYASTEFTSDTAQDAILAIGFDDCVKLWLNGKEVYRNEPWSSSKLDQATIPVTLEQGANQLLAKVSQAAGSWEFAARLRPTGDEEPLITLNANGSSSGDMSRLPLVEIDLLDDAEQVIDTIRVSGGRADKAGVRYTAYGAEPEPAPAAARVHFDAPGFLPYEKTIPWTQIRTSGAWISLAAPERVRGRVVDEKTGDPVEGAEILAGESPLARPTDAEGRFEFTMKDPLADIVEIRAPGYEPRDTRVEHDGEWIVNMAPGGHILRGRVLTANGEPIAGAHFAAYVARRQVNLTTDTEGRFELSGFSRSVTPMHPTVTHPNFVAKDRFNLPLEPDGLTEVEWQLHPGCTIEGRVTAKDSGEPLAGIEILEGTERFSSNVVNPQTYTDAEGRFQLGGVKPGSVKIHAFTDDYVPAVQMVNATSDGALSVDFELATGEAITGRVVDPEGNPVPGVTLAIDTINGARMLNRRINTDANGEFRYENMPNTPVKIDMFKRGWVSKRDYESRGGEHTEITLYPVVTHTARVRLADTGEAPQQLDAQIGYQWQGRDEISWQEEDYNDSFKYDAAAGEFRIQVDEPSNAKLSFRLRAPGYRDFVIENPELGTPAKSWDVVLEKTDSMRGKVVSAESGEPLADVMVALVTKADRLRLDHHVEFDSSFRAVDEFTGIHATSGPDGTFEVSQTAPADAAPADTDLLLFRRGGGFHYIPDAASVLTDGVELPLPAAGTIEGQVIVADEPVANVPVHVSWTAPGDEPMSYDLPFGFGGQITTDADGRFRFAGIGPGCYRVARVRHFDGPSGRSSMSTNFDAEEIVVLPGETVIHDFIRPAGHTISGQAVDADGKPAANCMINLTRPDAPSNQTDADMSDADGRFEFRHVQPGSYSLRAHQYVTNEWGGFTSGGGHGSGSVKVVNGDVATEIKLAPPQTRQTTQLGGAGTAPTIVGSIPPDFNGKLLGSDESLKLSDHYGKVVAIDFWATWCGPCIAVMPETKALYEKYQDSDDVEFITVSLDQDAETLKNFLDEQGIEFPVIYENREASQAIASSFGAVGIPSSFVIGRDGRFASERIHGSKLATALEEAVKAPISPQFGAGEKPARLMVKLSLDDDESGLSDAEISFKAFNDIGMPVGEETVRTPGQSKQLTWLYAPFEEGGRIEVTVAAEGLPTQKKTVSAPSEAAEVEFAFASPRTVRGSVSIEEDGKRTPVAGMKINVYRADGFRRVGISAVDGTFAIPVMPGSYYVAAIGNDKLAPITTEREQFEVAADQDPEPLEFAACKTVTVRGVVTDDDDQPVEGAEVRHALSEKSVKTDEEGRFELSGVPSRGQVQLYAIKRPKFALAMLEDCDGEELQTLVLGAQSNGQARQLAKGMKSPPLKLTKLADGEPIDWKPGDRDTLVLIAPLWHPATRDLVTRAKAWADEHEAELAVFSTDWSLEQAKREAAAYSDTVLSADAVRYAGPGGLEIDQAWSWVGKPQAYLVGSNGRISAAPPAGTLP